MYIKADYKDQYYEFLRSFKYPANTVRILRSDVKTLFIWLHTLEFNLPIENIHDEYKKYLISSGIPINTQNRRLSSVNKFLNWVYEQFPATQLRKDPKVYTDQPNSLNRDLSLVRSPFYFSALRSTFLLVGLIIALILTYLASSTLFPSKKQLLSNENASTSPYYLNFLLTIKSLNGTLQEGKDSISFKFYLVSDQSSSIGYAECPFMNTMMFGGSSRLRINLDAQCAQLSYQIYDAIARNEALLADVYINGLKVNSTKIALANMITNNNELTHQKETFDVLSNAGNVSQALLKSPSYGQVLGSEIATSSAALLESIPLSIFKDVPPVDEGDIVSIYDGEITRALLSTNILGIISNDAIITKGTAYIHIIDSTETPISIGDPISTSTTPGYGKKAVNAYDSLVGIALEPSAPGKSFLKVSLIAH
ncbi:hypothetical protein KBB12_01085 [Candidatus Woesebacteria bacterium]|nr:hypothetical protein [Candidatus Woesebacteria bacterium]